MFHALWFDRSWKRTPASQIERGRGSILLGSHLGSFEVLRARRVMQRGFPLKVLMDTAHNQNITRFFDALNPRIAGIVIGTDRPTH